MKVLIADKLSAEGIAKLEEAGYEVDVRTEHTPEELIAMVGEYDAMIIRSATTVTREVIEAGTNLKIIGRAGVGIDNVDVAAATEHGIIACNAPTSNIVSAAEHAFALMLAVARRIGAADKSMQEGNWNRSAFTGVELCDKTLAIFGVGHIGCLIAKRAAAFDMKLIGYDPYCKPELAKEYGIKLYDNLMDILPLADFITVHLPKTPETIGMFAAEQYAACKKGAILINDARGGIYNLDDLADAIRSGHIGGAGIDVYESEPCTSSPIHGLPNVVLTPHLGASTKEAQTRAAIQTAEFVILGLQGKPVPTAVNKIS